MINFSIFSAKLGMMIQLLALFFSVLSVAVGFGFSSSGESSESDSSSQNTDEPATELNIESKPFSEFEATFTHKGLECSRVTLIDSVQDATRFPFMSYACTDDSTNQLVPDKASAIRFANGDTVELEYSVFLGTGEDTADTEWSETFLTPAQPVKLSERFWFVETFSNGAHCCFTAHIVDAKNSSVTDTVSAGSRPFFIEEIGEQKLLSTSDGAYEYFWGAYADHVAPTLYYQVDSEGYAELYNSALPEEVISKEIDRFEDRIRELPESEIVTDRSVLCENSYELEGKQQCIFAKREARIIAAATATYLLADMEEEAEEYFSSKFQWNENTEKRFKEIKENIR